MAIQNPIQFDIYRPDNRLMLGQAQLGERMRTNRLAEADRAERMGLERTRQDMQRQRLEAELGQYDRDQVRSAVTDVAELYRSTGAIEDPARRQAAFEAGHSRLMGMYPEGLMSDFTNEWQQSEFDALQPFMRQPAQGGALSQKITTLESNLGRRLTPDELARAGGIAAPQGQAPRDRYVFQGGQWWDTQAEGGPAPTGDAPPDEPPKLSDINSLRGSYRTDTQAARESIEAFQQVRSLARAQPTAYSDLSLLTAFMRANDPGSVVRESELRAAGDAGSLPTRVQSMYEQWTSGKRLTADQRVELLNAARTAVRSRARSARETERRYTDIARRGGVNPSDVLTWTLNDDAYFQIFPEERGQGDQDLTEEAAARARLEAIARGEL